AAPFPYPADRPDLKNNTFVDQDVLVIPRGAAHPDEAFEFIKFVQSQEGMELLCLGQRKHTPLVKVSPSFLKQHPNPYIEMFARLAYSKASFFPPKIGIWPEYQAELNNAFDEIAQCRESPKAILDRVQARMQPRLDAYLRRLRLREEQERRTQRSVVQSGGETP
ncbi:MAG: hypothetical protein RMJ43_03080, partial [Chloroherpetonaceae bacterium]|nr:extracellular solute-binding protein [Chthonomonadaceae bacterium]MDW8206793.1 hypothetical protein [Chloroherpetonaceae bacterium]